MRTRQIRSAGIARRPGGPPVRRGGGVRADLAWRVVYGSRSEPPRSELEKYLWMRRFYAILAVLLFSSLAVCFALGTPTVVWVGLALLSLLWLASVVKLPFEIRRARRRNDDHAAD